MTQHDLTTKQTPLADLRQHPNNPRNGDVELIAESLNVNGQFKPIVTTIDGTVLAGNHTYQAALSLGWDQITTVALDLDPDSAEAKRVMLADNRTSDVSANKYDERSLLDLLNGFDEDWAGTGYVEYDIADLESHLKNTLPISDPKPIDVDDYDMENECPKCHFTWS